MAKVLIKSRKAPFNFHIFHRLSKIFCSNLFLYRKSSFVFHRFFPSYFHLHNSSSVRPEILFWRQWQRFRKDWDRLVGEFPQSANVSGPATDRIPFSCFPPDLPNLSGQICSISHRAMGHIRIAHSGICRTDRIRTGMSTRAPTSR